MPSFTNNSVWRYLPTVLHDNTNNVIKKKTNILYTYINFANVKKITFSGKGISWARYIKSKGNWTYSISIV